MFPLQNITVIMYFKHTIISYITIVNNLCSLSILEEPSSTMGVILSKYLSDLASHITHK